jgi:hypothetical protein
LSGTLPVELLRFEAEVVDQIPLLLWVTATERLASHFVIERSLLGSSFVPIGEVLAHGTSSVEIEYSFRDFEAIEGLWYYRLKMVDQDGTEEISNTIPVLVGRDEANPFLAPNPASKETRLISVSGTVFVCDLFGRVLLVEDASHIELTNIPNGLYIVISQDLGVKVPLVVEH